MKNIKLLLLLLLSSFFFYNCSSDGESGISPSNPDALSEVLVIPNAEIVNSPDLPESSSSTVAPAVSYVDTNISYTAGSQIVIPSNVASPISSNIAGVYIQVKGASTYFNVPINSATFNGTFTIPVNLPLNVDSGDFILLLKFYDLDGNISSITEILINVTKPVNCDRTKVSGGQGLTSTIFNLPNKVGVIKISYDTFTVKDKIDVFQDGQWIGGTGPSTVRSTLRRPLSCSAATESLGYVGQNSEFVFQFNPALGREIEVVVSGCENGGTAWEYTFSCPEEISVSNGNGNFSFNGVAKNGPCIAVPATQCTVGNKKDVIITTNSGESVVLYNMVSDASGTFSFVNFDSGTCNPFVIATVNSMSYAGYQNTTGSYTKTGPNSFTFNTTFRDFQNVQYTVSGAGSW
jgi:hypothetical protein